jgi:hypothetical protein
VSGEPGPNPSGLCICGCKRSLAGKRTDALWFSRACAVRWARENPGKSLYAAHSANKGRTKKIRRPFERGVQVSFHKAVEAASAAVIHGALQHITLPVDQKRLTAREIAELHLRGALPDRQRALLAAREQREETT